MPRPKSEPTIDRNGVPRPTGGQTKMAVRQLSRTAQTANVSPSQPTAQPRLTPRQQEVANLVACGLCDCEIAAKLGISENTVGDYLKVLFREFRVHTRTALAMHLLTGPRARTPSDFAGTPTNVGL